MRAKSKHVWSNQHELTTVISQIFVRNNISHAKFVVENNIFLTHNSFQHAKPRCLQENIGENLA